EFLYLEPETLDEALNKMENSKNKCEIIAGGTDLLIAMKQRLKTPEYLINLEKIPGLKKINEEANTIKLGPMNTLDEIASSDLIKARLPALRQAVWEVGSPLLRSLATIGGNICLNTRCRFYNQSFFWRSSRDKCYKAGGSLCHVTNQNDTCYSTFAADTVPVLISYGARIKLIGQAGERVLPLKEFYTGDGRAPNQILKGNNEILTEIEIPVPEENVRSLYKKYRLRQSIDFPLIGVAVSLNINTEKYCDDIYIILTGVGSAPLEAKKAKEELLGKKWQPEMVSSAVKAASAEIHPLKTTLVSPRYIREVAGVVINEALQEAGGILKNE
ncbi:MAG: hypothetical protein C4554_06805, partial [Dethiobacter sp.]